jgi:hypothetical protein
MLRTRKRAADLIRHSHKNKNGIIIMIINFECQKCKQIFDCDVGKIGIDDNSFRPIFEKSIICPKCGKLNMDEVFLTEIGQGQMTDTTMDL